MITYVASGANSISVVRTNDETGELIETIETISPVAPNPDNLEEGAFNGIATEWLCRHPKHPLLYVLTSYWSTRQAYITTFRINNDSKEGEPFLTKLGGCDSGGKQAVCGTFSADGSTFLVCHHNDGNLSVFDSSADNKPLEIPVEVIETPLLVEGSRRIVKGRDSGSPLPSLHHVIYGPNQKYFLTMDIAQDAVFTYPVDTRTGRPTSKAPSHTLRVRTDSTAPGWWLRFIFQWVLGNNNRPRRVAIHPNGKYVYVMYEVSNVVQVYGLDDEQTGKINPDCCQEVSTLDDGFSKSYFWPVGLTFNLAAELFATEHNKLIVANRGDILFGRAENTIRVYDMKQDGRELETSQALSMAGPTRYFLVSGNKIIAGTQSPSTTFLNGQRNALLCRSDDGKTLLHTFELKTVRDGTEQKYELLGQAKIDTGVFCLQCDG